MEPHRFCWRYSPLWKTEQVVELYGKRWNIEVDLRTLKGTLPSKGRYFIQRTRAPGNP